MAVNLLFKRGLAAKLPNEDSVQDGVFYLTQDTERIYVGMRKNPSDLKPRLVELNKSIRMVDSLTLLEQKTKSGDGIEIGDFYYVKAGAGSVSGNILAICSGFSPSNPDKPMWTQVNPDTNTKLEKTSANVKVDGTSQQGKAIVTTTVKDTSGNTSSGNFTISGDNVIVTVDGNEIKLSTPKGALYELSKGAVSNGASVKLTQNPDSDNTPAGEVKIIGGDHVNVTDTTEGIKVDLKANPAVKSINFTKKRAASGIGDLKKGANLILENGNGVKLETQFDPHVVLDTGDETSDEKDIQLTGVGDTDFKFNLPVYTKKGIHDLLDSRFESELKTFDAMHYKGILDQSTYNSLLAEDKVSIGDVYKASADYTVQNTEVKTGDLIIFNSTDGKEESDGFIAASKIKAEVVPSGDDQTISFILDKADGYIFVHDQTSKGTGSKVVGDGGKIGVSYDEIVVDGHKVLQSKVSHATQSVTDTQAEEVTVRNIGAERGDSDGGKQVVTLVSGVTVDSTGHISGVEKQTLNLYDTHNRLASYTYKTEDDGTGSGVNITSTITTSDGVPISAKFNVDGADNVIATAVDGTGKIPKIQLSLTWGDF